MKFRDKGDAYFFLKQTQSHGKSHQQMITLDILLKFLSLLKKIDFIDLPSIFQDKSVAQYIPTYFQNSESRIICYTYDKQIKNIIFDFN